MRNERYPEAVDYYKRAIAQADSQDGLDLQERVDLLGMHSNLANAYLKLGNEDGAISELKIVCPIFEGNWGATASLGHIYLQEYELLLFGSQIV